MSYSYFDFNFCQIVQAIKIGQLERKSWIGNQASKQLRDLRGKFRFDWEVKENNDKIPFPTTSGWRLPVCFQNVASSYTEASNWSSLFIQKSINQLLWEVKIHDQRWNPLKENIHIPSTQQSYKNAITRRSNGNEWNKNKLKIGRFGDWLWRHTINEVRDWQGEWPTLTNLKLIRSYNHT